MHHKQRHYHANRPGVLRHIGLYVKSPALKIAGKIYVLERGQDNGGLYNRIAMRTYQLAGVSACNTESVALFLNDEYLGCYNLITYYSPDTMAGDLYKCYFRNMFDLNQNHPLVSYSEKKFSQGNDLSNLEHLYYACSVFSDTDWYDFVRKNVDMEKTAAYLVVHDFLTVTDTEHSNFYIQYDGKYRIIPWDNEKCLLKDMRTYRPCSENQLVLRFASVPEIKELYNRIMRDLFTGGGDTCILSTLKTEVADMFDKLASAMKNDLEFGMSRQQFMEEKAFVLNYLDKDTGRVSDGDKLILH